MILYFLLYYTNIKNLTKAFDIVSHQRLLTKLYNYYSLIFQLYTIGISLRGNLINWIKKFIKGREQRVVVNNEFSDWTSVVSCIPQGSLLGPSLFTIFINDPNDITSNVNIFADDTKLYNSAHLNHLTQEDLLQWSNKWLLP